MTQGVFGSRPLEDRDRGTEGAELTKRAATSYRSGDAPMAIYPMG